MSEQSRQEHSGVKIRSTLFVNVWLLVRRKLFKEVKNPIFLAQSRTHMHICIHVATPLPGVKMVKMFIRFSH